MPGKMDLARAVLRQHFGYSDFRRGQIDAVDAVLSGSDTLAVLPTGGGKSLCYQVPALVFPGLTVVISPLISLMKDQVDRLLSRGVSATFLNSTLSPGDVSLRLAQATRGDLKLLYVAPERFEAPDLQRVLRRCAISLLAIDEAHCISEWGHDFRPSFRRIASVSEMLGKPQMIALTATATPMVRRDILKQLAMRAPRVIVNGFDRVNLHYAVRRCRDEAEKSRVLTDLAKTHDRPAIVYASTRSSVERIARQLTRSGRRALPYHAGLDDAHRQEVQDTFMRGGVDTIAATNAFGMGIDKPDVRLVVHYAMPGTLEGYYQEAGRAGRDGNPARCVLLNAPADRATHEWFLNGMHPQRAAVERLYVTLQGAHLRGGILQPPQGREAESALRVLRHHQVVLQPAFGATSFHIRQLATQKRIDHELTSPSDAPDLGILRELSRLGGASLHDGFSVRVTDIRAGVKARQARASLERLRSRQFVDFIPLDTGIRLARPAAPLDHFAIDWDALTRRRVADFEKLEMMQGYAHTKICRRAFVLRYFGEQMKGRHCGGCDNCLSS